MLDLVSVKGAGWKELRPGRVPGQGWLRQGQQGRGRLRELQGLLRSRELRVPDGPAWHPPAPA